FGSGTGFLFGWAQLTVVMPASIGAMAYVFADYYLQTFYPGERNVEFEVPLGENPLKLDAYFAIAAIVVIVLALTTIVGVFVGKTIQNLLTFAKIIGIGSIIVCGLCWYEPGAWNYYNRFGDDGRPLAWIGSLALILVMYAYGGWNDSAFVAAEVRNP